MILILPIIAYMIVKAFAGDGLAFIAMVATAAYVMEEANRQSGTGGWR